VVIFSPSILLVKNRFKLVILVNNRFRLVAKGKSKINNLANIKESSLNIQGSQERKKAMHQLLIDLTLNLSRSLIVSSWNLKRKEMIILMSSRFLLNNQVNK